MHCNSPHFFNHKNTHPIFHHNLTPPHTVPSMSSVFCVFISTMLIPPKLRAFQYFCVPVPYIWRCVISIISSSAINRKSNTYYFTTFPILNGIVYLQLYLIVFLFLLLQSPPWILLGVPLFRLLYGNFVIFRIVMEQSRCLGTVGYQCTVYRLWELHVSLLVFTLKSGYQIFSHKSSLYFK
jgi:hypothetical protein